MTWHNTKKTNTKPSFLKTHNILLKKMAKYITVLNSDLNKSYWKAIQWDNSLISIEANNYYTAGVNLNIPKTHGDHAIKTKIVKERTTYSKGTATIISLNKLTTDSLKLASNKASKSFLKKFES